MTTRQRDPQTSHDAGESITAADLSDLQAWILAALTKPHTDNELVAAHLQAYFYGEIKSRATPQRIRTARKELELRQLVRFTGATGLTEFGRKTQKWEAS